MKKMLILLVLTAFSLSGCALVSTPMSGGFMTNAKFPLNVTSNNIACEKEGKAKCKNILGFITYGDCSVEAAKKEGGIKEVSSVDVKVKSFLFFYASYETIVCGK